MSDREGERFEQALGEVERTLARDRTGLAFERAAPPFVLAAEPGQGGSGEGQGAAVERWHHALDWTAELWEPPPAPRAPAISAQPARAAPAPSDRPQAIAREIGLSPGLSLDELNRRWRSFVWRNHPDRRPDLDLELGTRRVAIANALVSEARRAILGERGSSRTAASAPKD